MSTFECPIVEFELEKHPNADKLSIAKVKGWTCCVKTEDFVDENFGVYIPIDAVAPKDHPLLGFLEGKKVKTVRLRGVISQGVLLPLEKVLETYPILRINLHYEGADLSKILEVKKWEEPIKPQKLSTGGVPHAEVSKPSWLGGIYDIENWNNHPNAIKEGEEVVITEKIHGSNACFALIEEEPYICSRKRALRMTDKIVYIPRFKNKILRRLVELSKLQIIFHIRKVIPPEDTVWHRIYKQYDLYTKLLKLSYILGGNIAIYGEIYGIQSLMYGLKKGDLDFRVFDIKGPDGEFLSPEKTIELTKSLYLPHVPILYKGPFGKKLLELRNGKTTISMGDKPHIREGIVIKPAIPRHEHMGRVVLKKVSEEYLLGNHTDY